MKKTWIIIGILSSALALTGCSDGENDKEKESDIKTEQTQNTSTAISPEQASYQEKIPFDDLYGTDEKVREYAEKMIGIKAPDFTINNVNGEPVSLNDFKGKNVILEMAQTTCGACIMTQPTVASFSVENPDIVVIQVFNDSTDAVNKFLKEHGGNHPETTLVDGYDAFMEYQTQFTPTILFIDKDGVIRLTHIGSLADSEVMKTFTDLSFQE